MVHTYWPRHDRVLSIISLDDPRRQFRVWLSVGHGCLPKSTRENARFISRLGSSSMDFLIGPDQTRFSVPVTVLQAFPDTYFTSAWRFAEESGGDRTKTLPMYSPVYFQWIVDYMTTQECPRLPSPCRDAYVLLHEMLVYFQLPVPAFFLAKPTDPIDTLRVLLRQTDADLARHRELLCTTLNQTPQLKEVLTQVWDTLLEEPEEYAVSSILREKVLPYLNQTYSDCRCKVRTAECANHRTVFVVRRAAFKGQHATWTIMRQLERTYSTGKGKVRTSRAHRGYYMLVRGTKCFGRVMRQTDWRFRMEKEVYTSHPLVDLHDPDLLNHLKATRIW